MYIQVTVYRCVALHMSIRNFLIHFTPASLNVLADLAKWIQFEHPFGLLIQLLPKTSPGVLDCDLVSIESEPLLVEGDPSSLSKGAEPGR